MTRHEGDRWPDEWEADLRAHHAEGLSASQSAAKFFQKYNKAMSRNTIIGKRHRLGLKSEQVAQRRPAPGPVRDERFPALAKDPIRLPAGPPPWSAAEDAILLGPSCSFDEIIRRIHEATGVTRTYWAVRGRRDHLKSKGIEVGTIARAHDAPNPDAPAPDAIAGGVLFWRLDEVRHCHAPFGDPSDLEDSFRFCGAPRRTGSSYCDHHHRLFWVPFDKRARSKPLDPWERRPK